MNDPAPPTTHEILCAAALRDKMVEMFGIERFTCDDCPSRFKCEFAFDPYNEDGDCLAEK